MSSVAAGQSVEREIAGIVGDQHMGPQELASSQLEINGVAPGVVAAPASAEEVAAVVRVAAERNLVVAPAGGFTKQDIGAVPERIDILLRTHRLNAIAEYDPGDLTVSVKAGMTFAALQATLGEHQQWLPYDAPNLARATVGGCLATGAAGPLKHTFGGLRDFCIGVRFVTADGKLGKGGGRVVKNVAGYDLMKLIAGSYGSLALITQANFKVYPRPRQTQTFICDFGSLAEAMQFRERIFRSPLTPICLEIISPHAPEYLSDPQPAVDPDHYVPSNPVTQPATIWQIALRAAGSDKVLERYRRDLGMALSRELHGADEEQFWRWVTHFEYNVLQRHRNAMIMCTHLTVQGIAPAINGLKKVAPDYNFIPAVLGRVATGNLVVAFVPLSVDPPSAMQYANCVSAYRGMLPPGSSAEVAHCPKEAKLHFDVWGTTPTDSAMMQAVKRAADPNNIFNRGRFIV